MRVKIGDMPNPIHAWALAYHRAGWCIVPARNKRAIVEWREFQRYKPTENQINGWFEHVPEDAQIALVTGKISNVSVIDIDVHMSDCASKKGRSCDCVAESTESLALKCGLTMRSITGSGGMHLFCNLEPDLRNSAKRLHPQIDVRSEAGIIILPPSLHSNGKRYEWDRLFPFNENNLRNMMDFPEGWKEKMQEKFRHDWTKIVLEGAPEGERNATLAALIGKLLWTFDRNHLQAAWQMIWMWNEHNRPPIEAKELERTFQSVVKTHFNGLVKYGKR